jgi:hypothetical protein
MVLGKLDLHVPKNKVGSLSHTMYKINSKGIKDLNVRLIPRRKQRETS